MDSTSFPGPSPTRSPHHTLRPHPRRPRGSQSCREKGRDESFQVRAKEPLGTDSHRAISKNSSWCRVLIGHKKCFVLLCPIGEQFLLSSFREFVHDGYCFDHSLFGSCTKQWPKNCTQSGNFQFDIKSPSDFKILSARKLKTLFRKYKLELTTGIHACIGHVLRKYQGIFERYHDGWQPRKHRVEKGTHIFSVSIVIIPTRLLCQMQANSSGAEFLSTISKFMKRMNFVIREIKIHVYAKRQTWICTTWPSFPLIFRLLFIASTQK